MDRSWTDQLARELGRDTPGRERSRGSSGTGRCFGVAKATAQALGPDRFLLVQSSSEIR